MDFINFYVFFILSDNNTSLKFITECKLVFGIPLILVNYANLRFIVPSPLGMESGAIKDSQITASSETAGGTRDQSRLNAGPEKAWCVNETDSVRTLTIDLQKEYSITKVKGLKRDCFFTMYSEQCLSKS